MAAAPAADSGQIVGAPVVNIAAGSTAPAKLIACTRCHGHCVAGTRFCKFCGAPLEEARLAEAGSRSEAPPPSVGPASARPKAVPEASRPAPRPASDEPSACAGSGDRPRAAADAADQSGRPGSRRRASASPPARLTVIVEDGSEGRSFNLEDALVDVGRSEGAIRLEDDPYVSPRHARFFHEGGKWMVRDLASTNGVFSRLRKTHPLRDGDLLLLGLEVVQFHAVSDAERGLGPATQHGTMLFGSPAVPRRARLAQRTVEGVVRDVYHVFRDETVIGREVGDIVFTADPFLSRKHAIIKRNPTSGEFTITDLDSSNGTFIAIRGDVELHSGDFLRVGQHLFRVDLA